MTDSERDSSSEEAPKEQSNSEPNAMYVWIGIVALLVLLIAVYAYWSTIVFLIDSVLMFAFALVVVYFVTYAVTYSLSEVFERKNIAAAIFLVGIFAVVAWLGVRFLM